MPSRLEAVRFLNQATFGPTEADIQRVMSRGYAAWLDEQFALPLAADYHWKRYASATGSVAGARTVYASFYTQALTAPDQLRQRVAFALSQIMVVSALDVNGDNTAAVAAYNDMLGRNAFGSYRTLLQDVALHPAMGLYLSHLKNRKEDLRFGRTPDQNFARELMQLFSIGLVKLRADGTPLVDAGGSPIETYTQDDIVGLSRVFTGWSWAGPDTTDPRFYGLPTARDSQRLKTPMQAYSKWHSVSEKRFLGKTIPPQASPDAAGDLRIALDTLAAHANVGPFIGRQLIQRLVTANPSPAYVARVAAVFANNGAGVRGDLKAVVRAILLDAEARAPAASQSAGFGKLREPVLRLTAALRAFGATSDSGRFLIAPTDEDNPNLAQTPLRSHSVFNFYRPGYVAPASRTGAAGMTEPELQITDESSTTGYVNVMAALIDRGIGYRGPNNTAARPDVQIGVAEELAVASDTGALVDRISTKLRGEQPNDALRAEIVAAVDSIAVPALKSNGSNLGAVQTAQRKRVNVALLLMLASPEFIVQR